MTYSPPSTIQMISVGGSVTSTGVINGQNIGHMTVGGNMAGLINLSGNLQALDVGGATPGLIVAQAIGHVTAGNGVGPIVLNIREAGVPRQLQVTPAAGAAGVPNPIFKYYYQSVLEGATVPQLAARVISTSSVPFDLNLATYNYNPATGTFTSHSSLNKFDLMRLDASSGTAANAHDITVEGDLITTVTAAPLVFFGLPAGTPGGVRLPLDNLGDVVARDYAAPASIQAASIQADGFGQYLSGGQIVSNTDTSLPPFRRAVGSTTVAFTLLVTGTKQVQANTSFTIPFGQYPVVFYMTTTSYPIFDSNYVLFVDQYPNDPWAATDGLPANSSVIATMNVAKSLTSPFTSVIQPLSAGAPAIALFGDGGSVQTTQWVNGPITSTGPIGDLSLQSTKGITGNITAPRIFGSILAPYGAISSIIQTTGVRIDPITGTSSAAVANLGRVYNNPVSGARVVTTVYAHGAITGEVISRGTLVSLVSTDTNLTGLIASVGDIGVNDFNKNGQPARFGGVTVNGVNSGQIITLGNIIGDVASTYLIGGRIAAKGSILGNTTIYGTFAVNSVIVAGGSIGNSATGTGLSVYNVSGIIAAKGSITIKRNGNLSAATIISNISPPQNSNATLSSAAIDAVFSSGGVSVTSFDVGFLDLANLNTIRQNLSRLRATTGSGGAKVLTDS